MTLKVQLHGLFRPSLVSRPFFFCFSTRWLLYVAEFLSDW